MAHEYLTENQDEICVLNGPTRKELMEKLIKAYRNFAMKKPAFYRWYSKTSLKPPLKNYIKQRS